MKSIKTFIQEEVLLPRLGRAGLLVVYDTERRCRELCLELDAPQRRVIDASESSIESREQAIEALRALGEPNPKLRERTPELDDGEDSFVRPSSSACPSAAASSRRYSSCRPRR